MLAEERTTNGSNPRPATLTSPVEGPVETRVSKGDSTSFEQVIVILRRRWKIIVACVLLVAAGSVGFSLLQRSEYTASASLLFRNTQFDQELFGSNFATGTAVDPTRDAATNIDLVSLPTVAARELLHS